MKLHKGDEEPLTGSNKENNSQRLHKTGRHWNSMFELSVETQKGSYLSGRVKVALEKGYNRSAPTKLKNKVPAKIKLKRP